jgi:multimeric flavodoxin WrbA
MNGICDDLNMRYVGSFSADMPDLLKEKERSALRLFAEEFFDAIERGTRPQRAYAPVVWREFDYTPGRVEEKVDPGGKKVLVVTDSEDGQTNLIRMVERFRASFAGDIEMVNLHDVDIKGPCLGCIQCGYDNHCVYEGKDGYVAFYNSKVKTADILVWAGTIHDRYLSSRWKLFLDRSFFNGHAPSLTGKQMGFIISGPLSQVQNLSQMLGSYVEFQHANLAGFVSDEFGDSAGIDDSLQDLARRLTRFADTGYARPHTFLGVGGAMLFRDAIWGRLRFPFRADFVAYRRSGAFDFPQKNLKSRIQNGLMLLLSRSPRFRKEVNRRMRDEMVKPLRKFLDD